MFLLIISMVLSLVGPVLAELIRQWLFAAEALLQEPAKDADPETVLKTFWDTVLQQIPLYHFRRRAIVWAIRNATLKHAGSLVYAARNGSTLTQAVSGRDQQAMAKEIAESL